MPLVEDKQTKKLIRFPDTMSVEEIKREMTSPRSARELSLLSQILGQIEQEQSTLQGISDKIRPVDLSPVIDALDDEAQRTLLGKILMAVQDKPQLDNSDVVSALGAVVTAQAETRAALKEVNTTLVRVLNKPRPKELEVIEFDNGKPKKVRVYYEAED